MDKYLKYIPEEWLSWIARFSDFLKKYKMIVLFSFFSLYIFFLYQNITLPSYKIYKDTLKQISSIKKIFSEKEKDIMAKDKVAIEMKDINVKLQEMEEKLFDLNSFNEFSINTLPRLIELSGAKVTTIRYEKVLKLEKGIMAYPIELSFWGSFSSVMDAVEKIETNEKLVRILNIQVTRRSVSPPTVAAELKLLGYGK